MSTPRLLVVDDDPDFLKRANQLLSPDYDVELCPTPEQALALLQTKAFHVVLLDLIYESKFVKSTYTSGGGGLRALRAIRNAHPELPVIVVSQTEDFQDVVEVYDLGAFHFVPKKALRLETLRNLLGKAMANARYEQQLAYQRAVCAQARNGMILRSTVMQEVLATADRYAKVDAPILLTGETGTGKNMLAEAIHLASGRKGRFECKNLTEYSFDLFASELFGTEPGAFTGAVRRPGLLEVADGGTVFLDEIGDLPDSMQVRLLRVLEEKTVCRLGSTVKRPIDVRFLFATQHDIDALVEQKRFRVDLFYRACQLRIHLPPLRERKEDLLDIAWHELQLQDGKKRRFTAAALDVLLGYGWPGNVRQLRGLVKGAYQQAAIHHPQDEWVAAEDLWRARLPRDERGMDGTAAPLSPAPVDELVGLAVLPPERLVPYAESLKRLTDALRKRCLDYALAREPRNKRRAAQLVGVSHETLYQWMGEFGYEACASDEMGAEDGA